MFPKVMTLSRHAMQVAQVAAKRNIGASAVAMNKVDPVQQMFLDKAREYYKKKSASKSGLLDSNPEAQKHLKDELEKISKQYGASATGEFPTFNFSEPTIELNTEKIERPQL